MAVVVMMMPEEKIYQTRVPEPTLAYRLPLAAVWKRPTVWIKPLHRNRFTDEQLAILIDLGFRTAINCGIDCSDILIRGGFHRTTQVVGRTVPDRCHVSYAFKTSWTFSNEHVAAHGYTVEEWNPFLTDSSQDPPKVDKIKNRHGNVIWPKNAVRLPSYLCPSNMENLRARIIKRAQAKAWNDGSHMVWDIRDPEDVSAQLSG